MGAWTMGVDRARWDCNDKMVMMMFPDKDFFKI
jgi:hypothetical protein